MQTASATEYNFDLWLDLAKNDPQRFEEMRAEAIGEIIQSTSGEQQMQLRRLQWRIDRLRERSGSPMAATLAISRMMWESFHNLKERFESLLKVDSVPALRSLNTEPAVEPVKQHSAEIIPFKLRMAD